MPPSERRRYIIKGKTKKTGRTCRMFFLEQELKKKKPMNCVNESYSGLLNTRTAEYKPTSRPIPVV